MTALDSSSFVIRPTLCMASDAEIRLTFQRAFEVLERIGVKVMHPDALELLRKAGVSVGSDGTVRLKPGQVEAAIASAPKDVTIFDREGRPALRLGGGNTGGRNTYYGTGSDLRFTYDPHSGERRLTVARDIANMACLVDALPDTDFLMSYGIPSDCPLKQTYRTEFMEMVRNSTKPIVFTSDHGADSEAIIEMAAVVAGGRQALRERPFVLNYAQPTSPLQHSKDALGKLLACAEAGIPICYPPGMIPGATAPVTVAGAVTQSLAESLSALAIHQLKQPGAPFVSAGAHGCFDMRTMVNVYAGPERLLSGGVLAAVYQHFGLPTWGFGGCTDSKVLDEQAAMESALLGFWASLIGVNLAHDAGYLASGMAGDLRAVVLNDEINGYVRHVLRQGVLFDADTTGVDAIERVGHGGNYMADDHTLLFFRTALWPTRFCDRDMLSAWAEKGETTMKQRLGDAVRSILADHHPAPLPPETVEKLEALRTR